MGYRKPQYRFASIYNPANAQLDPGVRDPVQLPSIPPVGRRQATAKQLNRSLKMDSENEYPPEDRYPDYPDYSSYGDYRQGNLYTSDENVTSDTGPSGQNYSLWEQQVDILINKLIKKSIIDININVDKNIKSS